MSATKEYFLRLSEESYNMLSDEGKQFLNFLNLECRQIATESELNDENYKKIRKHRIDAWNAEQEYLFKIRNNIK